MLIIPGFLIAIVTFPGVIVHELAHRFFCDLAGVPVYSVCYFRVGNPAGYVIHGRTARLGAAFLITAGPLLVNSLLCAIICFSPILAYAVQAQDVGISFGALMWLGISIGAHAFPSGQDMDSLEEAIDQSQPGIVVRGAVKTMAVLVFLANAARFIWFDVIYAFFVGSILPFLLIGKLVFHAMD